MAGLESGELTVDTLGKNYPMLSGNIVAICLSGLVCLVFGFVKPQVRASGWWGVWLA